MGTFKCDTCIRVIYLPKGKCKDGRTLYIARTAGNNRFQLHIIPYQREISYKTLSSTLKDLEADQLVHRKEYTQIPPKVEYSLTERGKSLIPILNGMCEWGDKNRMP